MISFRVPYPPITKGKVVVWGLLASKPFGGMIWQVIHHLIGFRRLGYDVWYVEDSHNPCMHPQTWDITWDFEDTTRFLQRTMSMIGLGDRWVFRPPKHPDSCVGARNHKGLKELYKEADVVFNLCGAHRLREDHDDIACLVLLQTDPVAPQLYADMGNQGILQLFSRYDYLFTYAENLGKPTCDLPTAGFKWFPTRPPVVIDLWSPKSTKVNNGRLTTVTNWHNKGFNIQWRGKTYLWEKHVEYKKLIDLPKYSKVPLEIAAVAWTSEDWEQMANHGWLTRTARNLSRAEDYQDYIAGSLGEFSVAKEQYTHFRSGWFSDRSACYLAAGNPVIMQDTGFGESIPTGCGLHSYNNFHEAISAIDEVANNTAQNQTRALELANEYFSAERLLSKVMSEIGI